ncbi:putative nucleocapsid protein [Zhuye pepper nucleorhabdovirus]|uniref:Nucleoprotein n=1 Tax=Zhuye pepper nucleorhabdovirus TaxID=2496274 RepID=A0A4P2UVV3_9RHAB|nr:putative nucleocapsid protein [Green Sichuan pepper nucleorhabdovirus]AZN18352.1 putative nucleocapsid protein [Zhuye pepper nucleorhabdovirus]
MADITISELGRVRPAFTSLRQGARPEISAGQCSHREYIFEEAAKSEIYHVATFADDEVIKVFNKITSPTFKEMTEVDLYEMLSAALNLKHPVTGELLFRSPWETQYLCADYMTAKPLSSSKVSMVRESAATVITTIVPETDRMETSEGPDEPAKLQAQAISFLFSWLTRFAVKSPSPALGIQYSKVKEAFMKFYQKSSSIFDKFSPDSTWILCLRNAFDAFIRVRNTLVLHVADAETRRKHDPKAFNVLRYLYFQNLEFMGMHAYVSIVNIMSKVALPPALILTWLRMSGAEMAIDEAYTIMSSLDNGMIESGDKSERLWKYARILDAGYFNRLQTSYAAELMATLAYIEIKLGISQEVGYSSPLNIYAISNNKHIKDIGKAKAEAFMECKNRTISLSHDASIVDKIYAHRQGVGIRQGLPTEEMPEASKRKQPEPSATVEASKKKKSPPAAGIPPPPPF